MVLLHLQPASYIWQNLTVNELRNYETYENVSDSRTRGDERDTDTNRFNNLLTQGHCFGQINLIC